MFIVGENLKQLIIQKNICNPKCFDEFSISLHLDNTIYKLKEKVEKVHFDKYKMDEFYEKKTLDNGELCLNSLECVLACSSEKIKIPVGYIGFLQTKGSLARHFVTVHCSDTQVEPGFYGKITFEIVNFSNRQIVIQVKQNIAQLFIARCSTDNSDKYHGKYFDADEPTIPKF